MKYKGKELKEITTSQVFDPPKPMFVGKPGCMTEEEHANGIELCLKDRFEGCWKGDILNSIPWRRNG